MVSLSQIQPFSSTPSPNTASSKENPSPYHLKLITNPRKRSTSQQRISWKSPSSLLPATRHLSLGKSSNPKRNASSLRAPRILCLSSWKCRRLNRRLTPISSKSTIDCTSVWGLFPLSKETYGTGYRSQLALCQWKWTPNENVVAHDNIEWILTCSRLNKRCTGYLNTDKRDKKPKNQTLFNRRFWDLMIWVTAPRQSFARF